MSAMHLPVQGRELFGSQISVHGSSSECSACESAGDPMDRHTEIRIRAYRRAQRAMAELKAATVDLLATAGAEGLRNSQIGRLLGIYQGHVRHQGHISRTILEMLQADGIAEQNGQGGPWQMRQQPAPEPEEGE